MVRLASVEFTKLKNVRAGTRLTFPETGAVLLGKNGTGKTTLLQYLVALCTADTNAFVSDEPFDVSATFRFGTGASAKLRLVGAPGPGSAVPFEGSSSIARYLPPEESTRLEYQIAVSDRRSEYTVIIADNRAELYHNNQLLCTPFPTTNHQYQLGSCLLKIGDLVGESKKPPLGHFFSAVIELMELQGALCRYDEGLDYFRMLTDESSSYLSLGIVIATNKNDSSASEIRGNVARLPSDLLDALTHNLGIAPQLESFSARHTRVAFLAEFVRLCRFSGATATAPIEARRVINNDILHECKSFRFTFDLHKERFSHIRLSFGQKRLLGYLYYLACNTQIGVADELVNGMHHEWIEHCLDAACTNRQMFYTSQNPLLLDFLIFQSEAEVSERFVTCKWNTQDGFVWENFDSRTGQEFYRLYKTGIQHVSDILRTKNWW